MTVPTSPAAVRSAERVLSVGTWAITAGAVLFSVLTVTPLMSAHTPAGWRWTAPILPLVVDAAVVIVVRLDSVLARLDGHGGRWPVVLRWLTGLFTLALNIGNSALSGDLVGVSVHLVAPALLIVTSEASLAYRRAITAALARIEREQAERTERERAERAQREQAARAERERERADRERGEREVREHAEEAAREEREHAARLQREEREHAAQLERDRAERDDARQRAQWEREDRERVQREQQDRERRERAERERSEAVAREQQAKQARERCEAAKTSESERVRALREQAHKAASVNADKLPEDEAITAIGAGVALGKSVRELADDTGWSVGWVSARIREHRDAVAAVRPDLAAKADLHAV